MNNLILIPKIEKYIEYMLIILLKLPRTEKYSIGTEIYFQRICIRIMYNNKRNYLANYKNNSNAGMVTIDNIRRTLSSFFAWLENEDNIVKSPVRRIHKVKTTKKVKETFTDENLEKLRDICSNVRDLAILELLISTGMRVGELTKLNMADMNFGERSYIVLGKGNSEREVYFSAKSKMYIKKYLEICK